MCGILAVFGAVDDIVAGLAIEAADRLAHRGPDGRGVHVQVVGERRGRLEEQRQAVLDAARVDAVRHVLVERRARRVANSFSLSPPMGNTSPRSVISPVIATSDLTGILVSTDTSAVHMATPALGPSLGVAPAGT